MDKAFQIKMFYQGREINEFLECDNHAGYVIMFSDNDELKLIPYREATEIKEEMKNARLRFRSTES